MTKVLCVGQSAYDITLPLDHYPIENKKVKIPDKVECGGGSSSNCAFLLAKWGIDATFAGIIGNDHYGNNILDEYITVGVDTKYLQISNRYPTTSSYIIANTSIGSRTILTYKDMGIHMAPVSLLDNEFDYILFDGYEKEFAMEAIRRNPKAITLLDAGSVKEATVELAKVVDYVICSHDFAIEYSKVDIDYDDIETIKKAYDILAKDFKHVIITLESYGCFTKIDGEYKIVPSIKVKAVDSTGAGDIYHGAFMYGLVKGFDIEKTMRFANITGALSCLKVGSRLSIPELKEVEDAYNANS